ncbi:uncharacterized protein LOC131673909 [Phymastichus coffea]|uniref:uncharacterized protein LOC131673909 n=1 Tax=Phymastichus coffea TaxID=108790 RepID=UPI00273BC738|nr:uncharacterized protein LOC131673909 [Phymastichus coffea]XP_058808271.1 uncharacterized protein LOC131673909 [Phymastichus coffea]XP_058808272.1 uncharacterized protein LOC131673909 [Phymastichus coffea]
MQISKAIAKSGKKIIKAIKKLSPHARLAKKLEYASRMARKDEQLSVSWWSLDKAKGPDDGLVVYAECGCCCCCRQFGDDEGLENDNLRNENIENEMLRC